MDTVQLKNFVMLAQTLNFSAVAKQEFISQPALTKQISRLEEELGVQLFRRSRHGVSLTYAGEEFYRHARDILDEIEKAQNHLVDIRKGLRGSLRLSSITGLDDMLSQSVARFSELYPDISVNIESGTGTQQILSINRQNADLFFSYAPLLEMFPALETVPLPDDRFAVYLHRRDAEKVREYGLPYLDELTHIMEYRSQGGPLFASTIFSIREALGLRSQNVKYHYANATVLITIQAGMGYSILPWEMNFGQCPENVEKIPLDIPEAVIPRALGWYRNSTSPVLERFVETVAETTKDESV